MYVVPPNTYWIGLYEHICNQTWRNRQIAGVVCEKSCRWLQARTVSLIDRPMLPMSCTDALPALSRRALPIDVRRALPTL